MCDHAESKVIDSRRLHQGIRRRECLECKERFTTVESWAVQRSKSEIDMLVSELKGLTLAMAGRIKQFQVKAER